MSLGRTHALGGDDTAVSGRVVDLDGRPVPGATVSVNTWWRPAVLRSDARVEDRPWIVQSGPDGRYRFPEEATLRRAMDADMVRVAAVRGELVSRGYVLRAKGGSLEVPLLVLHAPTQVDLTLRWPDGSPIPDAAVRLTMDNKAYVESDPRGAYFLAEGRSDQAGNWVVKRAPGGEYANIGLEITAGGAVNTFQSVEKQPTSRDGLIVLAITVDRGLRIEGSVFDADEKPASGVLVVDRDPESGDPDRGRYAAVDLTGNFVLEKSIPRSKWLVFSATSPLLVPIDFGQPQPIFVIPLQPNRPDKLRIDKIRLPRRRDVRVHVTESNGGSMMGNLVLQRLEFAHGAVPYQLDGSGNAVIKNVPVDVAHFLEFDGIHPTHGEIHTRFHLPAGDFQSSEFRVNGAGMLIVRFHAPTSGASYRVWDPTVTWRSGLGNRGVSRGGPHTEIRLFVGSARTGVAELRGSGIRPIIVPSVRLAEGHPTILDVVVSPE